MRYRALSNLTVHGRPVLIKHQVYTPDDLAAVLAQGLCSTGILVQIGDNSPAVNAEDPVPVATDPSPKAEETSELAPEGENTPKDETKLPKPPKNK